MSDDSDLVPTRYKDQIGRRYRSPHENGYVRRRVIVQEFARQLAIKKELLTTEKVARMVTALDRGHRVNARTISYDLAALRELGRAQSFPNGHRVVVEDKSGKRIYPSLRQAAMEEGCSKEAARKWLMKPGTPNRRGQRWSYYDPPEERPKTNQRQRKP
jgi:hypothetical protein